MKSRKTTIVVVCLVLTLIVFGMTMIYSASSYSANIKYGNSYYFVIKQFIGFVLGIVFFMFCYNFDYHKYSKIKYWVICISIVLLALIFVPGIGITSNGARRWIGVGGFTIQSSEIAKFGFVIFASCYMAANYKKMHTFKGALPVLIAGGTICLLILLEPNLSVTLCVGMVMLSMLFVGGMKIKHFLLLLIPALALVPILIIIEPYRLQRLTAFLNPWANPKEEGFQLIQSLYSLGSGGMFGVGLFNSRQKYLFLPFAESDFIFSIVGEELGFVGCVILCLVYLVLILYGIKIAYRAQDRLGTYLAFGITSVITMQLLINICVVTGLIPPTGIPLPFISAGGTSLSVFMGAIGILLNVDRKEQNNLSFNINVFKSKLKSRI
ncbi:MAG: putative lipid II flippase FtsW [Clostridia bacterium]|nr:putative lipid II flippase FtsW [Clostridia bacterium]